MATMIFLRGSGPSDLALGRIAGAFLCRAWFSCLAGGLLERHAQRRNPPPPTIAVGLRSSTTSWPIYTRVLFRENRKIALVGQGLGASVALLAGSRKLGVEAIAEWSGLLPNQFFSQVQSLPPLLILHGEQDKQVPIVNARQLVRLCELKDFTCEAGIYPDEGHVFSSNAMDSANQRALTFFRTYLWASLPKRAE